MAEPEDFSKLSTDDKLGHKVWKARLMGYEEVTKIFRRIDDEESSEYGKYVSLVRKFPVESNAFAQEKALEATLAFAECAAAATKICSEVIAGVVTKCLNARPKTKELGINVCLMFIEIEKQDIVLEEVMKGLSNKQPKIVLGSVQVIHKAVQEFGARVFNLKVLMKALPSIFEHTDKSVRAEVKSLAIELFRWIGPAVKPALDGKIKPVQMKELEEEFGKVTGGPPPPARMLRSQQQAAAQAVPTAATADGGGGGAAAVVQAPAIDPFDLIDPIDMLAKMPKDFYERIVDTKWKERKEVLEAILPLAQSPKLEPGDYGDLLKALKKVITKDSNVMVVALAGNIVTGLAKGLRKKFQPYASLTIAAMFEKFKEKKLNVVTSLREGVDAMYLTTTATAIQDDCVEALGNKNPSVKAETLLFLARSYQQSAPAMLPKPYLKVMVPLVVQRLEDTAPQVRDAACEVLGTLLKLLGDRPMVAYVENIEKTKMSKITEFREKVELKTPVGVPAATPSAPPPAAAPAASTEAEEPAKPVKKKPPVRKVKKKPDDGGGGEGDGPPAKKPAEKKPPAAAKAAPAKAPAGGGGGKGKAKGGGGAVGKVDEPPDQPESNIANEEVEEKAAEVLPSGLLEQLAHANWKERLAGHEQFKEFVEGISPGDMQSLLFVKVLARKPGWKDSNFQVMKAKFLLIAVLAEKAAVFGKRSMAACVPAMVDKLGDIKVKGQSGEALLLIAERMTLNYTSIQVLKHAMEQKSPKVQSESLDWLSGAVKEFGFLLNIKPHVDFIKKAFTATNPAVRTAAINLLGTIHMYLGAQLRMFFEDEKPAILQQIDAAFEKVSGETAPAPTRGPNVRSADEEAEEESGGGGGGGAAAAPVSLADLMPKVDISGQIKSDLIKELGDKGWKIRGEALQKVQGIIATAKFVQPSLGELPGALKGRLGDSNKNLIVVTLGIIGSLATAMGSACSKYNRVLLPGVLATLADAKSQLRAAAISCLNCWTTETTLTPLVEHEILSTALANENPNLRTELLGWLEEKLPSAGKLPAELQSMTPPLFSCLEDRSAEVRKKAQAVLPHLMAHLSYELMLKQCGKLKPASKQVVKPLLDKHRAAVQPKQAPPSQPSSKTATKESTPPPAQSSPPKADPPSKKGKQTASKKTTTATAAAKGGGGGGSEEDGAPLVLVAHAKEQRIKDEEKLKSLKWNFQLPRQEHINQLKDQLLPCTSRSLHTQLFHENFKQHLAAIAALTKVVKMDAHRDAVIGCLDSLLRWVTLRFFDTNTTVNLKCLELLHALFEGLVESGYRMSDYEASSILPYLVQKVGDAKDPVRKEVRLLFRELCSFYPPNKLFNHIMDGLKSKNARLRTECLEALGELIQNNGMSVCQPGGQKTLPLIAAQISDRDNAVRSAALNTMVVVYGNIGETVYKYTVQLPEKEISLLEERIKRSGKKFLPAAPPAIERGSSSPTHSSSSASSSYDIAVDPRMLTLTRPRGHKPLPVEETKETPPSPQPPVVDKAPPPAPPPSLLPTPTITSGRFKADLTKYSSKQAPGKVKGQPKLTKPDLSPFEGAVPTLSSSSLLASPPKPVVFTPIRLASHSSAINYIISQINSGDQEACVQALKQLDSIATSPDQQQLLKPHVDQLIRSVLMHMRINFTTNLSRAATPVDQKQVMEMGRHLTAVMDTVFSVGDLACGCTQETLVEVERDVFGYLVDEKLLKLAEIAQLNRAYNQLMGNMIGNCNSNAAFGSLLQVMLESLAADGSSTKMSELPMKCIWRLTRSIPTLLPSLNVDQLLLDVHHFYEGHSGITPSTDSKPWRTAKTILFHLASNMGRKVLDHLSLIPDPKSSQVTQYLRKTVAKKRISLEKPSSPSAANGAPSSSFIGAAKHVSDGSPSDREVSAFESMPLSTDNVIELTDILSKLKDPASSQQSLSELYDFQQKHPDISLSQYFKTSSSFFRGYIERGLKMVEEERSASDGGVSKPGSLTALHSDTLAVRERQHEATRLRASRVANIDWPTGEKPAGSRLPVKTSSSPRHNPPSTTTNAPPPPPPTSSSSTSTGGIGSGQDENKEPQLAPSTTAPPSSSSARSLDLSALRKRLDRLKGSGQQ